VGPEQAPGKPALGLSPAVEGDRILLVSGEAEASSRPYYLYLTAGDGSPAVVEQVGAEASPRPYLRSLHLSGRLGTHPFSLKVGAEASPRPYSAAKAARLDFSLDTEEENAAVVLQPAHSLHRFYINYPFGIEETKLRSVQTLDFLRIEGAEAVLTFIHTGMQHFELSPGSRVRNLLVGRGRYRFAITVSSASDEDRSASLRSALEFYSPLLWALIGPQEGELPEAMSFLSLSDEAILVTSLRIKGDGLFLRLFNPTHRRRTTWLELVGLQGAHLVDFQHHLLDSLVPEEGKVKVQLNPWQIRTLKLEVKRCSKQC
jgi:hypothetical protein